MPTTALRSSSAESSGLVQGLGFIPATAIVVSTIVGSGVFLVASAMAQATGSLRIILAAWALGAVIALCGAFCFAELGAALPEAGGLYIYLTRALGPLWGFLFGWMNSIVALPVAVAALAAAFVRFAGFIFPAMIAPWLTFHFASHVFTLSKAEPSAAAVVLLLTALNYLSVRVGGAVQLICSVIKVGSVVAIVIAGIFFAKPAAYLVSHPAALGIGGTLTTLVLALVPVMWAFNGIQNLGYMGAEIRNPAKNIPRALLCGILIVSILYFLANFTYFRVLSVSQVASSQHVASDVMQLVIGSGSAIWLTVAIAISVLATLHAVIMTEARIPYAMAHRGLFFKLAGRLQPRFRSPSGALLLIGTLGMLMALTGTFEELFSLYIFVMWIFFALGGLAVIRLRATEPDLPRPYRAWAYPLTPIIFAVADLAVTVSLWIAHPIRSSLGLLLILAGIPFYAYWRRNQVATPPSLEKPMPPLEEPTPAL
ncbi:MAG TPA: amino acid permease [Acidobacteriaceae bacterium]|nr:amino acid permease [Acidobacteriaceae bacterium]